MSNLRRMCYLFLVLISTFFALVNAKVTWQSCSSRIDYKVDVQGVSVIPDPVVKGVDATFKIPAITKDPITGGTVVIDVYYFGIHVHSEKDDLCSKTECPVAPGEFTLTNSQPLPDFTPSGSYRLNMNVYDTDGSLLTCVKISFKIVGSVNQLESSDLNRFSEDRFVHED